MYKLLIAILISNVTFAKSVDLREYQTPVKSQLDRNTCAYFAVTALIESIIKIKYKKTYDISEQFQIFYGKEHFGEYPNQEHGSTYDIALNFSRQYFFINEKDIPYQKSYFEKNMPCENQDYLDQSTPSYCFSQGPIEWKKIKSVRTSGLKVDWISGMWRIGATRAELIQEKIENKEPVVLTFKVYPPLWDQSPVTYTEETEKKCNDKTYSCYGHAVLLTGFDSEKREFTFKNSWGTSWGNEGYGTLSYEYVNKFSDMPISVYFDRILALLRE